MTNGSNLNQQPIAEFEGQKLQDFDLPAVAIQKLRLKLQNKPDIFTFDSDPFLASLIACLGIQFDLGKKDWDRLSAPLNVTIQGSSVTWQSKLISYGEEIGLYFWSPQIEEFKPAHPDLRYILHPLSLDGDGKLSRLIIFPNLIARHFKKLGLDLVIVKDWVLNSFLAESIESTTNYLVTNELEIQSGTALLQARLLVDRQLAFSGTHDLVDHLLGIAPEDFLRHQALYRQVRDQIEAAMSEPHPRPNLMRVLIYLMGVVMDDMAQPVWYKSDKHFQVLNMALRNLKDLKNLSRDKKDISLPTPFHKLMFLLREQAPLAEIVQSYQELLTN